MSTLRKVVCAISLLLVLGGTAAPASAGPCGVVNEQLTKYGWGTPC